MELNVTNTKRKCKLKFELGDKLAAAPPAGGSQSERVSSADIKPHLSGRRRNSVSHIAYAFTHDPMNVSTKLGQDSLSGVEMHNTHSQLMFTFGFFKC